MASLTPIFFIWFSTENMTVAFLVKRLSVSSSSRYWGCDAGLGKRLLHEFTKIFLVNLHGGHVYGNRNRGKSLCLPGADC